MNYYKRHLGDYARDTRHLSLAEHGAFNVLLDYYYSTERPIPAERVKRIASSYSVKERKAFTSVLIEFFVLTSDGWQQKKADRVIAEFAEKAAKAAESANVRWMRSHSVGNANAERTHPKRNASHKPLATSHEEAKEESKPFARAARLPDDWQPTPDLITWAHRERPEIALRIQIDAFRDHWHSSGGANARKLNWNMAFRNWIRKAENARGSHGRKLSAVEQVERDIFENHANRKPPIG